MMIMTTRVPAAGFSTPMPLSPLNFLPDTIIQHLAAYLTPEDTSRVRCMDRRLEKLLGDNRIWRVYYRSLGLGIPAAAPNAAGQIAFPSLAKQFPLWESLKQTIDSAVERAHRLIDKLWLKEPRSLCIAVLTIPELRPLHDYAVRTLKAHCGTSLNLTANKLIERVVKGEPNFEVCLGARILAVKSLSKRQKDPMVRNALLSAFNDPSFAKYGWDISLAYSEVIKGLIPYLPDPEIEENILDILRQHGLWIVGPTLDKLVMFPKFLDAIIHHFARRGYGGFHAIIYNHLNNPSVVEQLTSRLITANNPTIVKGLADALRPVADQESVQQALCQKLIEPNTDDDTKDLLKRVLYAAPLTQRIINTYGPFLPKLEELAREKSITPSNLQELFTAMWSRNESERIAAATALAPLVPNNSDVLKIFLRSINAKDFGEVGIIVVSALVKVEHREDICTALLLEGGPLVYSENPRLRLATIRTLSPFIDKPEIRQAFLRRLELDDDSDVRCTLIDILAPQLREEDVRTLFLEAANNRLFKQSYFSGTTWQIAAIDKLRSVVDRPEVAKNLYRIFSARTSNEVRAACIRALCLNPQKSLIKPSAILNACIDFSDEVREEAHRALLLFVSNQFAY